MRKLIDKYLHIVLMLAAMLCIGSVALAQNQPDPAQPDPNQPDPPPQVHVQGGGGPVMITTVRGGGAMQGAFRIGGPMMQMDHLMPFLGTLGQVNLKTAFTLTADQKTKIQAIRDDFKKQSDEWKQQHAEEIKQIEEQHQELMQGLQNGNMPDPGQMQEIEEQRRALYESAPTGEDHVAQIKALFTPEQTRVFEAHEAMMQKEREAMMGKFGGRMILTPGGMMPPPPPPAPPADPNQPEPEKKK